MINDHLFSSSHRTLLPTNWSDVHKMATDSKDHHSTWWGGLVYLQPLDGMLPEYSLNPRLLGRHWHGMKSSLLANFSIYKFVRNLRWHFHPWDLRAISPTLFGNITTAFKASHCDHLICATYRPTLAQPNEWGPLQQTIHFNSWFSCGTQLNGWG